MHVVIGSLDQSSGILVYFHWYVFPLCDLLCSSRDLDAIVGLVRSLELISDPWYSRSTSVHLIKKEASDCEASGRFVSALQISLALQVAARFASKSPVYPGNESQLAVTW